MTPRPTGRTAACGRTEAVNRLQQAEKSYEVAQLVETESDSVPASASVAAALAVLAGIAASDAACCAALGKRSRGADHKRAVELLAGIAPDGPDSSQHLDRLLDLKDSAHYGLIHVTPRELKMAMRQAAALIEHAPSVVQR